MDKKIGEVGYYDSPKLAAARRELKERALERERTMYARIAKMRYRQILPIPDKYVVLLFGEDESGEFGYLDYEREGYTFPFFILTEDAVGDSVIGVYSIDSMGVGEFEPDFRLALRRPHSSAIL